MKFEISKIMIPVAVLTFAAGCGSSASNTTEELEQNEPLTSQLVGTWQSDCVDSGNGHIRLTFRMTVSTWDLDYDAFADTVCETGFMTVNIKGPYDLGDASAAVEGAREGRFYFEERVVTPHMDAAVDMLAGACPDGVFGVGESSDMREGCANLGLYPVSDCPNEYDIVRLDGSTLNFGARPADNNMCSEEKRPTALGLPLQKKS